jgi:hypothetical protein
MAQEWRNSFPTAYDTLCQVFIRRGRVIEAFFCEQHLVNGAILHRALFAHKPLCTEAFLHTNKFYRRCCKQKLLHINAWTHNFFYLHTLLHTWACPDKRFWFLIFKTGIFIHKHFFCTNNVTHTHGLTHGHFLLIFVRTQKHWHAKVFPEKLWDTNVFSVHALFRYLFHTDAVRSGTFSATQTAHKQFNTETFSHRMFYQERFLAHTFFCQQTNLLHRKTVSLLDAFLWRTEIYTHRSFHTQTRSHTDTCAYWRFDTQRAFYTQRRSEGPQESLVYGVTRFNN